MTNSPITPPPELFSEWFANSLKKLDRTVSRDDTGTTGLIAGEVAIQAARWGADQELEACCEWLEQNCGRWDLPAALRAARRPKPLSLKEQDTICAELVAIEDALSGGSVQLSNQGQAMDGYAALAAFRAVAEKARAVLNDL